MTTFINANTHALHSGNTKEIVDTFYRQGFVIVQGASLRKDNELNHLSELLNLGESYTSSYNKKYFPNKNRNLKSEIGEKEENKDKFSHPVFELTDALEQHVDGTFSPLGEIKTTLLLCKTPALSGGETTLFNAYGAILEMEKEAPGSTEPFRNKSALRRRSTFKGIDDEFTDAALGTDEKYGREIIRLTFDSSADWEYGFGMVPGLKRAYERLVDIKDNLPSFCLEFPLNKGDIIVMDNARITHGRKAFKQDKQNPRMMIRSVHVRLPSVR